MVTCLDTHLDHLQVNVEHRVNYRCMRNVIYVKWLFFWSFEVQWSEVSHGEVLGDRSGVCIRVTLCWAYLIVLLLFHLVCILRCGCSNLFCNVWVCVCVGSVKCGCFGNMCTCIYCVLCCFFMYIYSYLFCLYQSKDYCHRVASQLQEVIIIIIIIIIVTYTGRFIMFSVITNIYNKKTKGPNSVELFTGTGKLEKFFFFFFTTIDVRCVHHGWHGIHRYDIQVLATHTRQHGCIDILHCWKDPCL